jgi:hypothetical protein
VVACGALVVAACVVVAASAVYVDAANVPSNQFSAAATFPTYPESVAADAPLLYHRLDDGSGSTTAADSSGNDLTGVYTPANASDNLALAMPFDDNAGTTARDLSGRVPALDGTVNGATWTSAGRYNSAVSFNGTSNYVATSGPAVATNASFSVSAWVYMTNLFGHRGIVSQDGQAASGFMLKYDPSVARFVFMMPSTDINNPAVVQASSTTAVSTDTWYHLAGVYDDPNNQLRIYLNGSLQGTVTRTANWSATGAVAVGRTKWNGSNADFLAGRIDEVRLWSGVISQAGVTELAQGVTSGPMLSYPFSEGTGTTTQDVSGTANLGTLTNGATWGAGPSGHGNAAAFNGSNNSVEGTRSAVRTDQSFTVSAWVFPTAFGIPRTAVSQDATSISGFYLGYSSGINKWVFSMHTADITGSPLARATSNLAPSLNAWVHLTGVFDDAADQVRLYLNGTLQTTTATFTSNWLASGAVAVGRAKWNGANTDWWAGRIDGVQIFSRTLTSAEAGYVYNGGSPPNSLGTASLTAPGALAGGEAGSTAAAFSSSARNAYNPIPYSNPTTYSLECWFRTFGVSGATNGQTLLSFGNRASGNSTTADRRIFLDTSGRLVAGTSSGTSGAAQTTATHWDGSWHHVVATVSPATGIQLYVDGELAASAAYSAPGSYTGYWRWAGDTWAVVWPADYAWRVTIDEVAVYGTALPAQRIAAHYHSRNR